MATYYISPTGTDGAGISGDATHPWLTLYYACTRVTTAGDTIHVNIGTYIETLECLLAVGVSIVGEGDESYIKHHYSTPLYPTFDHGCIKLSSASPQTNGNQSISYIKLDGEYDYLLGNNTSTGNLAIFVDNRSNVKVHHCTIVNFYTDAIVFQNNWLFQSTGVYESGNEIHDCTIMNCTDAGGTWNGSNMIRLVWQENVLIYNNLLRSDSRPMGYNGGIINCDRIRNVKYYNNISYKPDDEGDNLNPPEDPYGGLPTGWNFHMEMWNIQGGFELYNNEFHGGACPIDIGGYSTIKGSYDYSWSFHDNLIQTISDQVTYSMNSHGWWPITLESYQCEYVYIYNNHFKNHPQIISIGDNWMIPLETFNTYGYNQNNFNHIYFYDNLIENTGWYTSEPQAIIEVRCALNARTGEITVNGNPITVSNLPTITDNIHIFNNTVIVRSQAQALGIDVYCGEPGHPGGNMSNVYIKNNIICYSRLFTPILVECYGAGEATIDVCEIKNNLLYSPTYLNNPTFSIVPINSPDSTGTVTNLTISNNIPTSNNTQLDPLFISSENFHLRYNSPAINMGIDVGEPYIGTAPDIGVYEYRRRMLIS